MNCRVLYLVGQLGTGGLERQLCYLLQSMDRQRYRPELLVWSFRDDDTFVSHIRRLGVPLHSFSDNLSATRKLLALRCMVTKMRPEVIHSYTFYTNFAAWWATRGTTTIPIGSSRSDFVFDKKVCGPLLGRLSALWPRDQICNNHIAVKRACREPSPFVPQRFSVVRNGVDFERFRIAPLSTSKQTIISAVGSLIPLKRWDRLLRAALELKHRGVNVLIRIAGEGPLRGALQKQAAELGVADRVQLIGHTDDIPGFLANSILLVHTSDIEGCPNAIMEAMACGRAVVAMNAGDIPDLIEDGKTGFLVPRGDDLALVERLLQLITDRDLCRSMGEAGRAKAKCEFGLDRLVCETLAAYQSAGWKDS